MDFDAFSFVDHIVMTRNQYAGYGNGYMDVWTAMTYVAAITNAQGWRPILTQSVVDIPYRQPIQQAKIAATLDSLSEGRLMIGAGSGYNEEEFRALSIDIRKRGEMTHEYLACMKELMSNQFASFHGKYANFDNMTLSVRPVQDPHPPILYGSHGPAPRRRIAESYQGIISGPGSTPESQQAWQDDIRDLERLWKENGRSGKPFIQGGAGGHLTTNRDEVGEVVSKGVVPAGQELAAPATGTSPWTRGGTRMPEGQERVYISTYNLRHVDDLVADLRQQEEMGVDLAFIGVPSYSFRGMTNLELHLQQMDLLAEYVLPKLNRDTKPIEMDFAGKTLRPFGGGA